MHSSLRRLLLPCLIISALSSPASAQTYYDFSISNAPPAARYEVVPEPRYGYVWAPGYWNWDNRRYVWVSGRWMEDRPGYAWSGEHWEHHDNGWHLARGHWKEARWDYDRDRGHDWDGRDHGWHTTHQSWDSDRRWRHN